MNLRTPATLPDVDLPAEVAAPLAAARAVERAARAGQRPVARAATGRLMAALMTAGWRSAAIGRAVGLTPSAVTYRVRAARRAGIPPLGITLTAPRPTAAKAVRRVDDPDWLTPRAARALLGVHRTTLHGWRRAGLLPHTRLAGNQFRYARHDLLTIQRLRNGHTTLPAGTRTSTPDHAARPIGVWPGPRPHPPTADQHRVPAPKSSTRRPGAGSSAQRTPARA